MDHLEDSRQSRDLEVNWVTEIADVRGGAELGGAVRETLTRGLRVIVSRRVKAVYRPMVLRRVLIAVGEAIRSGAANNAEEVARVARAAMQDILQTEPEILGSEPPAQGLPAPAVLSALSNLSQRQRDMLHRYYVRDEQPEEICRAMRTSTDEFERTRSQLRKLAARVASESPGDARRIPA